MRGGLAQHQHDEGLRCQHHLFKRAVSVIIGEQARQRQHAGKQSGDPDYAGTQCPQQHRIGADAERKQADDDDEKNQAGHDIGAPAQRDFQIARNHRNYAVKEARRAHVDSSTRLIPGDGIGTS